MAEEKQIHFEWWKLVIGSAVAIIVVLVPLVWSSFENKEPAPQFCLSSPIFTPNTTVKVYARNDEAQKEENIHVEWDGLLFSHGAKILKKREIKYSWEFTPEQLIKDKKFMNVGPHKVRFGFNNSKFSDYLQIQVSEQPTISVPSLGLTRNTNMPNTPGKKRALIIGNSKYPQIPLQNPVNDANLISQSLIKLGFEVTLGRNLPENETRAILKKYASTIGENDTSIFYFSGFGVQLSGVNYLLPIDAKIEDARDIKLYGISIEEVTRLTEGLKNQVALYASTPGTRAYDSSPGLNNGPFAFSLAKNITKPDVELSTAFRKVIQDVSKLTNGHQIPWYHSTAIDDIILNKTKRNGLDLNDVQSASIIIIDACTEPFDLVR